MIFSGIRIVRSWLPLVRRSSVVVDYDYWFLKSMFFWPWKTISITEDRTTCMSSLISDINVFLTFEHDLYCNWGSLMSIPEGRDQLSPIVDSNSWVRKPMFFTPRMTHIRTPWPLLPEVRPNFNYHWSLLRVSKTNVFLTFDPKNDS